MHIKLNINIIASLNVTVPYLSARVIRVSTQRQNKQQLYGIIGGTQPCGR